MAGQEPIAENRLTPELITNVDSEPRRAAAGSPASISLWLRPSSAPLGPPPAHCRLLGGRWRACPPSSLLLLRLSRPSLVQTRPPKGSRRARHSPAWHPSSGA